MINNNTSINFIHVRSSHYFDPSLPSIKLDLIQTHDLRSLPWLYDPSQHGISMEHLWNMMVFKFSMAIPGTSIIRYPYVYKAYERAM